MSKRKTSVYKDIELALSMSPAALVQCWPETSLWNQFSLSKVIQQDDEWAKTLCIVSRNTHAVFSDESCDFWAKLSGNFSQVATDIRAQIFISLRHVKHWMSILWLHFWGFWYPNPWKLKNRFEIQSSTACVLYTVSQVRETHLRSETGCCN